jgi:hypothetical protein
MAALLSFDLDMQLQYGDNKRIYAEPMIFYRVLSCMRCHMSIATPRAIQIVPDTSTTIEQCLITFGC